MTTLKPRVSPALEEPATSAEPSKKSRFRRRHKRNSSSTSNTVPTFSRSHSSSQMSLDSSSTHSTNAAKQKRRSLLHRLLRKSSSSKKFVEIPVPYEDDDHHHDETNCEERQDAEQEETHLYLALEERGVQQRQQGQAESALATWKEALILATSVRQSNQILCRMISLHLELHETQPSADHFTEVTALISQLEPLQNDAADTTTNCLEGSPLLLELLTAQSCWTWALQVSHSMPETEPLTLARLHLEVALQTDKVSHLSECHQLLLSYDGPEQDTQTLWQELAQAYATLGEDELAMASIQSRMQHLESPTEQALAHYDQALNVYSPVGQYGLALKQAEVALSLVSQSQSNVHEDVELLKIKLYQFKADVLCRMGRISDSIQSYELLLQAYQNSPTHGPVDAANVLYILGKLSVRAKQFVKALEYFDQELQMTKSVVGQQHLASSKILHELARVCESGMMDYPRAVGYYEEALQIESAVYQQCRKQLQQQGTINASTTALLQEARSQMGETKQRLGKLHFKMGDFATAVKTTLAVDK